MNTHEHDQDVDSLLTTDLSNVSLALPLLPKDTYRLKVTKVDYAVSDAGKKNIKIALVTTEPVTSVAGETVGAGFPIYDNISLTPTENYPLSSIQKRLKAFRLAVVGEAAGSFLPVEQYENKIVNALVKVQPARDGFDERNVVGRYVTD